MELVKEAKKLIFSVEGHIEKIISGHKTQTRRQSPRYKISSLQSIQPGRRKKGIPDGKIFIIATRKEVKTSNPQWFQVLPYESHAEGGYTPEEYEELYEKINPNWKVRYCYLFCYYTTEEIELFKKGLINEAFKKIVARKKGENENAKHSD